MAQLKEAIESDVWPRSLGKFKSVKSELQIVDGLVSKMGELVVPEALRPKVLSAAHIGHPGIVAI